MATIDKNYSDYLVIFVDLLGSKSRYETKSFNEIYDTMLLFHSEFKKNANNDMDYRAYERKIFTFSDCAYIFYSFKNEISDEQKDEGMLFTVALCNTEPILLKLLSKNILFRGGITYGKAFADSQDNIFFGPAVKDAYNMEDKDAVFPRIIIDEFVAEKAINSIEENKYKILGNPQFLKCHPEYILCVASQVLPQIPETGDGIIEKDDDSNYILNYLFSPENNISFPGIYLSSKEFMEDVLSYINDQIKVTQDSKVLEKLNYSNNFIQSKLDSLAK